MLAVVKDLRSNTKALTNDNEFKILHKYLHGKAHLDILRAWVVSLPIYLLNLTQLPLRCDLQLQHYCIEEMDSFHILKAPKLQLRKPTRHSDVIREHRQSFHSPLLRIFLYLSLQVQPIYVQIY